MNINCHIRCLVNLFNKNYLLSEQNNYASYFIGNNSVACRSPKDAKVVDAALDKWSKIRQHAYPIKDTGVDISTRILTRGGATVQCTISFTCKICLVAKFLFFNLDTSKPCKITFQFII